MKARSIAAAALVAALAGTASAAPVERGAWLAAHAREAGAGSPMTAARPALEADSRVAHGRRSTATPAANPRRGAAAAPLVVNEGFESVETFAQTGGALKGGLYANGWLRQNNSDAPYLLWYKGALNVFPAKDGAPDAYLAQNWYATQSDTGTASAWVMTPPIHFGSGASVSFYTRTVEASTQPDRLQVRACSGACTDVGTQPEDVGDYGTVLLDINPTEVAGGYPETWTRYTLTAADGLPASGIGRVAFRYYFHQNDGVLRGSYVGIDRVVIDEGTPAASPLGLAVTVAPADANAPDACGSAASLDVAVGDAVNVCYRLTNHTADTLRWHVLRDDVTGALITAHDRDLAPGATWQVNRVIIAGGEASPSVTWQASREHPGYVADDTQPAQYIDATDGTEIDAGEVFWGADLPFPKNFDFRLYGERVDSLCMMDYGFVASRHYEFCPWGVSPGSAVPNFDYTGLGSGMALYSASMMQGGRFFQKTIGTAPNRRYVLAYHDKPVVGSAPGHELRAQIVLNETTDVIEFQYANTQFGGNEVIDWGGVASIGLQNRQLGHQYSLYSPSLRNVSRIAWRPSDPATLSTTTKIHIAAHAPVLRTNATSINAAVPAHGSATATFAIANDGDGRLDWTAGKDAAATAHFPAQAHATPRPVNARPFDPVGNAAARTVGQAKPAAPAGDIELPLWAFDIANGYLLQTNAQTPGYTYQEGRIAGYPGARFITGADFLDDDFSQLYAYDNATHQLLRYGPIVDAPNAYGNETVLGTLALPTLPFGHGLKQDPTTGVVYLVTTDGTESHLWTVDTASLAVREVGLVAGSPGLLAIAFDADGRLYGVDGVLDVLVAIDKATGAAQEIGPLGVTTGASVSALAFDGADGTLYFASFIDSHGVFYRVDTVTGAATPVNDIAGIDGGIAQFGAMAFTHRTARCTRAADVPWLTVTPGSGSIVPGGAPATLTLGFDGSALDDGTYRANLCVHSNDPYQRRRAVPVRFTVGQGDDIFADGFD